jgi:RNA polymerase primary sigma factor
MITADPGLERYLADIRRLGRIGEIEEMELIAQAKAGSVDARNRVIQAHLRFVLKVALHYRQGPVPIQDLISEGVLGLARAIDTYEKRGIKFITYAVWWIRNFMVRAIEDKGSVIRLSAHEHARLRREKQGLNSAREKGQAVAMVRAYSSTRVSETREEEDWQDSSRLADELLSDRRLEDHIRLLVSRLPDREAFVLRNAFGIDQEEGGTLREIGSELGLSQERIRQIREEALGRLRKDVSPIGPLSVWL